MGAHPYFYFVPYQPDINAALQSLRLREFRAGRYNPAVPFPFDGGAHSPGAQHQTIEEALEASGADGTRSILDLARIADEPEFCSAAPLPDELLADLYGTTRPTRQMLEGNDDFLEDVERGHGVYTILYRDGKPDEIYFAGYSFD